MENLNAEKIINEIQSLIKTLKNCGGWVKRGNGEGWFNHEILADALAIIESQEQKIFSLENRLKECENGYEGTLFLDRCKLRDAEKKVKELAEENERLRRDNEVLAAELSRYTENIVQMAKQDRADAVRKMHSEIKERCIKSGIYPAFVASTIDQIAKELEGEA